MTGGTCASPTGVLGQYGYDAFGRRVWRSVTTPASASIHYIYDPQGHLLAEHDGATGDVVREYVWIDDTPLAVIDASSGTAQTYFIHTGQIEEPLVMTDASQAKVWDAYVEPFGAAQVFGTPSASLDLRLPGQQLQAETGGLNQNWFRDYDPSLGRYAEADPLGIAAGQNIYAYVDGKPMEFVDRKGLFLFPWEKPVTVRGGTSAERAQVISSLQMIFHTPRGGQLLEKIKGPWWWHGSPKHIILNCIQKNGTGDDVNIDIDPDIPENDFIITDVGLMPLDLTRIIAHELGHATTHEDDPENIFENENPIMNQLGEWWSRINTTVVEVSGG